REPLDHAEQVVVDQEVLPEARVGAESELRQTRERDLTRGAHGRAKTRAAFASTFSASASASTPRIAATALSVSSTYAGRFGLPRCGTGARYGVSVSSSSSSAGTLAAAAASAVADGYVTLPA